jgi:DNA-directed RNA polymerase specialized sigma24 family protein
MHLAVIEQLGQAEIAEVLGISAGAVKSNLAAARKQLREELRPIYEAYCKAPVQRTR